MNNMGFSRPNVILITIDSLAATDMSLYGYSRLTTPYLSQLAKRCYVFDAMFANSTSSLSGFFSILSGKYPRRNYLGNLLSFTKKLWHGKQVAGILKQVGYTVIAAAGLRNRCFMLEKNKLSVDSGDVSSKSCFFRYNTRRSLETTLRAATRLIVTSAAPFFAWLHLYPPHAPYIPSRRFRHRFLQSETYYDHAMQRPYIRRFYSEDEQPAIDAMRSCYNEQILDVDYNLSDFICDLEVKGLLDNSVLIITSDHGELFERGYMGHCGPYLYNPLIRIPLLIRLPGQSEGKRIACNAGQVDIAPTILDVLGVEVPKWMDGQSLKPAMMNQPLCRPVFSTNSQIRKLEIDAAAVIHHEYKLIYSVRRNSLELYNLHADDAERHNIAFQKKELTAYLKTMLRNYI